MLAQGNDFSAKCTARLFEDILDGYDKVIESCLIFSGI
jgi:hypothetical protein